MIFPLKVMNQRKKMPQNVLYRCETRTNDKHGGWNIYIIIL